MRDLYNVKAGWGRLQVKPVLMRILADGPVHPGRGWFMRILRTRRDQIRLHRVFTYMEMAQGGALPRQDLDGEKTPFRGPQQDGEAGLKKGGQDHLQGQIKTQIGSIQAVDGEGIQQVGDGETWR